MFMPVWILWSKKKKFVIIFQKENGNTFTLLIIFIAKSLQKEQNSTNLLLWPIICRNKHAITPKWFNSLDTNSSWKVFVSFNLMRSSKNCVKLLFLSFLLFRENADRFFFLVIFEQNLSKYSILKLDTWSGEQHKNKQLNHFNGGVIVALAFILWVRPLKIEEAPLKVPDLVQRELLPLYKVFFIIKISHSSFLLYDRTTIARLSDGTPER